MVTAMAVYRCKVVWAGRVYTGTSRIIDSWWACGVCNSEGGRGVVSERRTARKSVAGRLHYAAQRDRRRDTERLPRADAHAWPLPFIPITTGQKCSAVRTFLRSIRGDKLGMNVVRAREGEASRQSSPLSLCTCSGPDRTYPLKSPSAAL